MFPNDKNDPRGPIEKAFAGDISGGHPKMLGSPPSSRAAEILVSCMGCGAVFVKSRIEDQPEPGPRDPIQHPNPHSIVGSAVTCPCCLQTQGWREIADVKFGSVEAR